MSAVDESGTPLVLDQNRRGPGVDTTNVRDGRGRFSLKIDSANLDWIVRVEEKRYRCFVPAPLLALVCGRVAARPHALDIGR